MTAKTFNVATVGDQGVDARELIATAKFLGMFDPVLDHIARRTVVLAAAAKAKISASADELQAEADVFRRALKLHGARETNEWLASVDHSVDDFEREMEYRVVCRKKRESFSPSEVDAFLHENRGSFEKALVSHIVTKDEGLARELVQQVKGEKKDFGKLAAKHSVDEATRAAGGHLGWVTRAALAPDVAAKVFAAKPGDCLAPIKLPGGRFEVVYVHEVTKPALDDRTAAEIRAGLLAKWVDRLLGETKVAAARA